MLYIGEDEDYKICDRSIRVVENVPTPYSCKQSNHIYTQLHHMTLICLKQLLGRNVEILSI